MARILLVFVLLLLSACAPALTPLSTPTYTPTPTTPSTSTYTPTPTQPSTPTYTPTSNPQSTSAPTSSTASESQVFVTRVIDGDTIEVSVAGTIYKVRYIGIDTPELKDKRADIFALAQEATRYNRQLVEGKYVRLEKDISETDKYDRLLRYVYLGEFWSEPLRLDTLG